MVLPKGNATEPRRFHGRRPAHASSIDELPTASGMGPASGFFTQGSADARSGCATEAYKLPAGRAPAEQAARRPLRLRPPLVRRATRDRPAGGSPGCGPVCLSRQRHMGDRSGESRRQKEACYSCRRYCRLAPAMEFSICSGTPNDSLIPGKVV